MFIKKKKKTKHTKNPGLILVGVKLLNPINFQPTLTTFDRSCCAQGSSVTVTHGDTDPSKSQTFSGSHMEVMTAAEEGASSRLCCLSE